MSESRPSSRFNPTDATLWAIKRDPELRTTIVGLALLDRSPDWATFVNSIEKTVARLPRLRQCVAEAPLGLGRPRWVDASPDLEFHLRRVTLAPPGDRRGLLDLVGRLAGEDFEEDRPLWELHLVDGMADDQVALVMKVSHSLTDGVQGMGLLRAIGDDLDAETGRAGPGRVPSPRSHPGNGRAGAVSHVASAVNASARAGRHPVRTMESTVKLTGSAARLLAPAGQPLSPLMTGRSAERWAAVTDLPLDRLRRAAHRASGTINDAFVTIAVSALADYHAELGSDGTRFRVTLPVNLRPPTDRSAPSAAAETPDRTTAGSSRITARSSRSTAGSSRITAGSSRNTAGAENPKVGGNQWSPARLVLDVDRQAHPFAELRRHQDVLRRAIGEPAIPFTQLLAAGMLELPPALTTSIVGGMVKGSDIAISDVPGLTEPLTLAGSQLTHFYPFAPTGGAALNIGLVSHVGTACIGFTIDPAAITEPERLVRCFEARAADFLRRRKAPAATRPDRPPTAPAQPTVDDRSGPGEGNRPGVDRLSALDTGFLRMESSTTPMHLGGLFLIDGQGLFDADNQLDMEALRRHVEVRLERMPRLRRKLKEVPLGLARPVWVDHSGFDVADHVHHRTLPAPGSRAQLLDLCQTLQMQLLDRRRPLFDLTFVDGLDPAEFGPDALALVERVHHALMDGMSGVEMVALLFDVEPGEGPGHEQPVVDRTTSIDEPGPIRLMVDAAASQARQPLALAKLTARAIAKPRGTATDLGRVVGTVTDLLKPGQLRAGPLDHPVGKRRRLGSISVPLALVHDTGSRLGGSVNDVVLTAVTQGARTLLNAREGPLPASFVVLVPVSTRRLGMEGEHGNQVAALAVELPIHDDNLLAMFGAVSHRMNRLKASHHADGTEILLDAADHLPLPAVDLVARLVGHQRSVDMVVTNLPGPPTPLFLGGNPVREMIPILPLGGNLTIGVAVLSYDGNLIISFHDGDDDHDDLDVITEATRTALLDLAATVGQAAPT